MWSPVRRCNGTPLTRFSNSSPSVMVLLAIYWIIYLALHSLLASNACKGWVSQHIGLKGSGYRFAYSFISVVGLIALGWVIRDMPQKWLFDPGNFIYAGYFLIVAGIVIVFFSFRYLSGMEFIGLRKFSSEDKLVTHGIHSRVRHPIYTGTIAILLEYFIYQPSDVVMVLVVLILIYLPIGIYFEERKLIQKFGEAYLNYKKEVPSILPGLKSLL